MSLGGREGYNSDEARDLDDIKTDLASSAESVDESLGRVAYASAPSSPSKSGLKVSTDFCLLSVKQRISSLENLADRQSERLVKMTLEDDLRPFIGSRAAYKGKITATLSGLKKISDDGKRSAGRCCYGGGLGRSLLSQLRFALYPLGSEAR